MNDTTTYNIKDISFSELLCMLYSKIDLEHAYTIFCTSTSYSQISDNTAKKIGQLSKKVLKTVRVATVRDAVNVAIDMYSEVGNNHDLNAIKIKEAKKRSICMTHLEEIEDTIEVE